MEPALCSVPCLAEDQISHHYVWVMYEYVYDLCRLCMIYVMVNLCYVYVMNILCTLTPVAEDPDTK